MALKPITQVFERTMAAVEQIEKQLDDSSMRLDEVLEEVRAQSQAIFILIDRAPPP
jgi:exonuclease VII small subunit